MTRYTVSMINRRACLRDALDACDCAEVREEVAAHLTRRYKIRRHAVNQAIDIVDATQEHGMPPRVMDAQIDMDMPGPRGAAAWLAFAAAGALVALVIAIGVTAVSGAIEGGAEQVEEWRSWR